MVVPDPPPNAPGAITASDEARAAPVSVKLRERPSTGGSATGSTRDTEAGSPAKSAEDLQEWQDSDSDLNAPRPAAAAEATAAAAEPAQPPAPPPPHLPKVVTPPAPPAPPHAAPPQAAPRPGCAAGGAETPRRLPDARAAQAAAWPPEGEVLDRRWAHPEEGLAIQVLARHVVRLGRSGRLLEQAIGNAYRAAPGGRDAWRCWSFLSRQDGLTAYVDEKMRLLDLYDKYKAPGASFSTRHDDACVDGQMTMSQLYGRRSLLPRVADEEARDQLPFPGTLSSVPPAQDEAAAPHMDAAVGERVLLPIPCIRFAHDSQRELFGHIQTASVGPPSILQLAVELLTGLTRHNNVPSFSVCKHEGHWYAYTGNRRLAAWRIVNRIAPDRFPSLRMKVAPTDKAFFMPTAGLPAKLTTSKNGPACQGRWLVIRETGEAVGRYLPGCTEFGRDLLMLLPKLPVGWDAPKAVIPPPVPQGATAAAAPGAGARDAAASSETEDDSDDSESSEDEDDDAWGAWTSKNLPSARACGVVEGETAYSAEEREALAKLPVRELKRRLDEKGISIPAGTLEKKELVDLLCKGPGPQKTKDLRKFLGRNAAQAAKKAKRAAKAEQKAKPAETQNKKEGGKKKKRGGRQEAKAARSQRKAEAKAAASAAPAKRMPRAGPPPLRPAPPAPAPHGAWGAAFGAPPAPPPPPCAPSGFQPPPPGAPPHHTVYIAGSYTAKPPGPPPQTGGMGLEPPFLAVGASRKARSLAGPGGVPMSMTAPAHAHLFSPLVPPGVAPMSHPFYPRMPGPSPAAPSTQAPKTPPRRSGKTPAGPARSSSSSSSSSSSEPSPPPKSRQARRPEARHRQQGDGKRRPSARRSSGRPPSAERPARKRRSRSRRRSPSRRARARRSRSRRGRGRSGPRAARGGGATGSASEGRRSRASSRLMELMAAGSGDEAHGGGGAPASAAGTSPPRAAAGGGRGRQPPPGAAASEGAEPSEAASEEGAAPEGCELEVQAPAGCYAAAASTGRGEYEGPPAAGAAELALAEEDELEAWLLGLDQGRGKMLQYLGPLREEFGSLMAVAAAYIPGGGNGPPRGFLESVEPLIFDVLQVVSLGHRLLLARGIAELAAAGLAEEQAAAGAGEGGGSAATPLGDG